MANPVWPETLHPAAVEWRLAKAGLQFRSPFTGSLQAVDFVGEHWEVRIALAGEGKRRQRSGQLDALLMWLAGGVNVVDIYHWGRPVPVGTMHGSPVVGTSAAIGASTLILTVAAGSTLKAGDMIGAGSQVFMVKTDCTASGTALTVPLVNRLRTAIGSSSAVTWSKPKVGVVCPEMSGGLVYRPGMTLPTELALIEL